MKQETTKIVPAISPFDNESEVVTIGSLTIDNRLDRITVSGNVDITKDKLGYEYIFALKRQIDAIADFMKMAELPDKVETLETKEVGNPFSNE